MARPVKITPFKHKSGRWVIFIPARLSSTGKRQSVYFKSLREANDKIKEIKEIASDMREMERLMSPSEYDGIVNELARLIPFDVSLEEVIDYYIDRHRSKDAKLIDLIAPIYQDEIRDKSTQYKARVRQIISRFRSDFGDMMLDDITPDLFEQWLAEWKTSASSYNSVLRHIKPFFNWAIKMEYALRSPASRASQRKVQAGAISILSPRQARRVIEACCSHENDVDMPDDLRVDSSDAVTAIGIMLFAGIRPHEVTLLDWEHIKLDHGYIRVEPEVSKTNSVRLVKIEDNLRKWINLVPESKRYGKITPKNWSRKWKAIRRAADIATLNDVCRHSYASYWLAKYRDTHGLLENMGHTTSKTAIKYYLTACLPEDVAEYWGIVPTQESY